LTDASKTAERHASLGERAIGGGREGREQGGSKKTLNLAKEPKKTTRRGKGDSKDQSGEANHRFLKKSATNQRAKRVLKRPLGNQEKYRNSYLASQGFATAASNVATELNNRGREKPGKGFQETYLQEQ